MKLSKKNPHSSPSSFSYSQTNFRRNQNFNEKLKQMVDEELVGQFTEALAQELANDRAKARVLRR